MSPKPPVRCGYSSRTALLGRRPGSATLPPGAGTELQGLRERAALVGGEVIAGPVGTGWQVQLTIPTQAPP